MSTVQRFFRKYFLSTIGILLLSLTVNIVLIGVILITANNNSTDPDVPIGRLAGMVTETDGTISAMQEVSETLTDSNPIPRQSRRWRPPDSIICSRSRRRPIPKP